MPPAAGPVTEKILPPPSSVGGRAPPSSAPPAASLVGPAPVSLVADANQPAIEAGCFACAGTSRDAYNRGGTRWSSAQSGQQHRARYGPSTIGHHRYFHVAGNLALAGLAPELEDGLVEEAEAVEAAGGELAAVGVERQ